jgi:hypothetical protein
MGLLAGEPTVVAVRSETVGSRPAVRVVIDGTPTAVAVRREGAEVVVRVGGARAANAIAPQVSAPVEAVRIEREPQGTALRVRVPPDTAYEIQREPGAVTVVFGVKAEPQPPPQPAPQRSPSPDVADLLRSVFPPPVAGGAEATADGEATSSEAASQDEPSGLHLGALLLRPSVRSNYVDGELTLEAAQPVRDRYYQIVPRLGIEAPLALGQITAGYEARIQRESSFEIVETTTHVADARLELPLGGRLTLSSSAHYHRGALETTELDPGREYFFRLGRFTRRQGTAGLHVDLASRVQLQLDGAANRVEVSDEAGFFDYETRSASAALRIEVSPVLGLSLHYGLDRVPPPAERPLAESRSRSFDAVLDGEVLPLVNGRISVGYSERESPRLEGDAGRYRGLVFAAGVTKEFTRATALKLTGSRQTLLSAFEENAFYVSTVGQVELTMGLPLSLSARGGAGYHWNQYRTAASAIGVPREDRIFGWSVGVGRPITSWSYVRVDYRRERRDSNLDELDSRSRVLSFQLGLGVFPAASP